MRVLVVNAGSSSLKLAVMEGEQHVAATVVERWNGSGHVEPIRDFVAEAGPVDAVGHRVVHGGPLFTAPVELTPGVLDDLDSLAGLAPLHNPRAVAAIREADRILPGVPHVACFDTAFYAGLPAEARTYALPRSWNDYWGLRRYGFHGLSHSYAVRRAAAIVGRPGGRLRVVSAHLGAGASLAAVRNGKVVDTTMGFTPLDGLVMQTRSGAVDPGLLLWLIQEGRVAPEHLAEVLEHRSGLKGLSGTSGDLREVLAGRDAGDDGCALAYGVFVHRLRREIGAMAASAGGLDVLVMTGGIGEHVPEVRSAVVKGLRHLGLAIHKSANEAAGADADVSSRSAAARTVVVTASEETEIARDTIGVLAKGRSGR